MIVRKLGAAVAAAVLVTFAQAQTPDHDPGAHPTPHATGKPQGGDDKDKTGDQELAARRAEAKEFREKMHAFMDKHPRLREELFEQKAERSERTDDKALAEEFRQFEAMIHARCEVVRKRAMERHEERVDRREDRADNRQDRKEDRADNRQDRKEDRADDRQDRKEDRADDRQDRHDGDRPRTGAARPRPKN
jgi:hypothetical protein